MKYPLFNKMSLLKWKELATRKSELGNKINFVHDTILKNTLGEKTSQTSLEKVFKPITTKLDDVIVSNLKIPIRKRQQLKKVEVPNYGIDIDDEVQDMNLGDLFDGPVLPQQNKQIAPKPPTYEESLQDVLEGKKQIYMNPDIIQPEDELQPEYDDDEEIDYALDDEDTIKAKLDDIGIANYESVEKQLNDPTMTPIRTKKYLGKILLEAIIKRNQLKGYKAHVTKQFKSDKISEAK